MSYYRQKLNSDNAKMLSAYQNSGEIFELIVAFENCTLARERWTAATYLTVVFWYVYMNPLPEARRLINNGIRRYNFEHNIITKTNSKDNEILILLLVRAVNEYLKQNRGAVSFVDLVNGLFRHFADEKQRENDRKQKFHIANSKRVRSNKYEFSSN